jgi:hypothetical protein
VTELLCLLLKPALLCASNPWRYWYLAPIAVAALLIDMVLAHTAWAVFAGFPRIGEATISDTLERLCLSWAHPDHLLFREIAKKINRVAGYAHIRAVA